MVPPLPGRGHTSQQQPFIFQPLAAGDGIGVGMGMGMGAASAGITLDTHVSL